MVTLAHSDPLTDGMTGGGSLVRWFGLLVRWLRGARSASESPELEWMTVRARAIGAPVLAATSRQDLTDRLDAAWSGPDFGQLLREAIPAMTAGTFASVAISADDLDDMKPILGETPAAIIASTAPLISILGGVVAHLMADTEVDVNELPADLYDLVANSGLHSTIKRGLLGSFRASSALMAISHAVFQGVRIEPWLALALAESYRDELYLSVRVYASVPSDIEVPESVVPLEDRYDWDQLQAEVDANEFLWNNIAGLAGGELSLCDVPDDDDDQAG